MGQHVCHVEVVTAGLSTHVCQPKEGEDKAGRDGGEVMEKGECGDSLINALVTLCHPCQPPLYKGCKRRTCTYLWVNTVQ